jgi:hypothetical protein
LEASVANPASSCRLRRFVSAAAFLVLSCVIASQAGAAKSIVKDMYDVFSVGPRPAHSPAVSETTILHQAFFADLEAGTAPGWGVVNYRQGQPLGWNRVSGAHSCVGQAWWCGRSGLAHGDGYDNNWVQILKTVAPINLAGSTDNVLTFKHRMQSEEGYDWGWVLIHDAAPGSPWDTLAGYSGNPGSACANASLPILNSWTTRPQPIQLMFLFGSDLSVSASDSTAAFSGWSIDDVKVTASGSVVKFFDDMEGGSANWVSETPNPGPLWHLESYPGTSVPATCYFLSTYVWVPFPGFGFGLVPDFVDAMVTTPPINIQGVIRTGFPLLRLQFDNWINLPPQNGVFWSLWIQGSSDGVTWTPWRNAIDPIVFAGGVAQCVEGSYVDFDPYYTIRTGLQPGTPLIRLGLRLRDQKPTTIADADGEILRLGVRTEGIYFDNIGVYYTYTITGVEAVSATPSGARASIRKVHPNPFNPTTTIEFSVPEPSPTTLRIYDLHGRAVATLVRETMAAGLYRARWDGKTDEGSDLSSGIYFAQVECAGSRGSARLMLVR